MSSHVWYVAYGSNVYAERFDLYLKKSRETTPPTGSRAIPVPHPVVFAGASRRWNHRGVAFLDVDIDLGATGAPPSLCRAWRISHSQFEDVYRQENGLADVLPIDLKARGPHDPVVCTTYTRRYARQRVVGTWYRRLHQFDDIDGEPAVTFTSATRMDPLNPADPSYLRVIAAGLAQSWDLDLAEAAAYLHRCPGIADGFTIEELRQALPGPIEL